MKMDGNSCAQPKCVCLPLRTKKKLDKFYFPLVNFILLLLRHFIMAFLCSNLHDGKWIWRHGVVGMSEGWLIKLVKMKMNVNCMRGVLPSHLDRETSKFTMKKKIENAALVLMMTYHLWFFYLCLTPQMATWNRPTYRCLPYQFRLSIENISLETFHCTRCGVQSIRNDY